MWIDDTLEKARAHFNKAVVDQNDQLFVVSFKLLNDSKASTYPT